MAKEPRSMPQVATKHEIATSRVNLPVNVPEYLWDSISIHELPEIGLQSTLQSRQSRLGFGQSVG